MLILCYSWDLDLEHLFLGGIYAGMMQQEDTISTNLYFMSLTTLLLAKCPRVAADSLLSFLFPSTLSSQ
jgi:hypothetical protein